VFIQPVFFICSSVDGHLGWFHYLTIVHGAKKNMEAQESLLYANFDFFEHIPRSDIIASNDSSLFNFLRKL
jgi:hypothetical protein